jgi:hypothetical protein
MSDAAIAQEPIEPVPPAPPGPEATAELDAMPPQAAAVDGLAPATDQGVAAPTEFAPAVDEVSSEVPSADARAALEIEHPIGPVRQGVLDHLIDSDGPQTVAQIIAGLGNYARGTIEAAVLREYRSGRIERVAPGTYRLAPPKPPEPPKSSKPPPPEPVVRSDGHTDEEWLAWLGDWRPGGKWEGPGNPPGQPGCVVPPGAVAKHNDRVRKRLERQRERDATAARQGAADAELRARLRAVCHGNVMAGRGLDDMTVIRTMLQVVRLEDVLIGLKRVVDRRLDPRAEPIAHWTDKRFLEAVARRYSSDVLIPSMIAAWEAAGRTSAPTAPNSPPTGDMPDIDELRSRHDNEHAPAGPHTLLATPDVAMQAPANASDASEPPAAAPPGPRRTANRTSGPTAAA